ncbi:hypothetical protein B0T22DRAFT_501554 [Podospora appendiculata]|uniref:Uncharacterized protein n=1 Tax=Podospora appendiculata TaxID=314037 RepID=A0AAE0X3Y7_9PEZI|nr:hypothetical protein B0T22DRAFT_501554 [Podospora appendiculata]
MRVILALSLISLALNLSQVDAFASIEQFKSWYPQYGFIFRHLLQNDCAKQYDNYLTRDKKDAKIDYMGGADWWSALTQPVVQCLLNGSGEFVKSQMSSAQVLLGVAPTTLALIGPSAEEMSTLLIVGRRPLLYLILTCGSPSVFFTRAFQYTNPAELLSDHRFRLRQHHPTGILRRGVTLLEYVLALGAMANAIDVHSDLGLRTICPVLPDWTVAPLLWGGLGAVVHLGWLKRLAASEFTMCAHHENLHYSVRRETKKYIIFSWLLSMVTMVHIVFGTLVLSSLLFIGPRDALSVVGRYMASVVLCRVILMYELSGLRDAYKTSFVIRRGGYLT